MDGKHIKVAKDYSIIVGGRYIDEGDFSGEDFRKKHLEPFFKSNTENKLIIDLDGTYGYPTSFLEEAFGGLVRELGSEVIARIDFKSQQEPDLIEEISEYMQDAKAV